LEKFGEAYSNFILDKFAISLINFILHQLYPLSTLSFINFILTNFILINFILYQLYPLSTIMTIRERDDKKSSHPINPKDFLFGIFDIV
jgi:hypothetical protein